MGQLNTVVFWVWPSCADSLCTTILPFDSTKLFDYLLIRLEKSCASVSVKTFTWANHFHSLVRARDLKFNAEICGIDLVLAINNLATFFAGVPSVLGF
jgi:hypothetical protein